MVRGELGRSDPGKKALGLVVLHDDGTPILWPAALARNLLRAIDFLPFLYGFGFLAMLMNRDFKRLGDLAAGTIVTYREEPPHGFQVPEGAPLAPSVALTLPEQRAILDFAERTPGLTAERAAELAAIPRELVGSASGPGATGAADPDRKLSRRAALEATHAPGRFSSAPRARLGAIRALARPPRRAPHAHRVPRP